MTFADQDPDPDQPDDDVPGWLDWPNIPVINLTLGSILALIRRWRNR